MRLSGYQPQYFPRLHYYNRALDSDIFEFSDYLEFVPKHDFPTSDGKVQRGKSYQAHTPIKLGNGVQLLVIPTRGHNLPITQTPIDYSQKELRKHIKTLEVAFARAKNFSKFFPELKQLLEGEHKSLGDLTIQSALWGFARILTDDQLPNLTTVTVNKLLTDKKNPFRLKRIFLASESGVPKPNKGGANDWIIELCKYAEADEYFYGGTSYSSYMDLDKFEKAGIKTSLQDWNCSAYTQQYPKLGFIPNLSILDLVMNEDLPIRQKILL